MTAFYNMQQTDVCCTVSAFKNKTIYQISKLTK